MLRALVLTGDGINCEQETAFALSQAGVESRIVHISDLLSAPELLKDVQLLMLPGGFSFGDEISSGKILALKLYYGLGDVLSSFVSSGKLVMGICNGFQALVKLGLLPDTRLGQPQVSLIHNRQRRFINRWVTMNTTGSNLFLDGLETLDLPIRHGEGRLVLPQQPSEDLLKVLNASQALVYDQDVNGSWQNTAALVNTQGNVLGLMPHPEAFVRWSQHPAWREMADAEKSGLTPGAQVFSNIARALKEGV